MYIFKWLLFIYKFVFSFFILKISITVQLDPYDTNNSIQCVNYVDLIGNKMLISMFVCSCSMTCVCVLRLRWILKSLFLLIFILFI